MGETEKGKYNKIIITSRGPHTRTYTINKCIQDVIGSSINPVNPPDPVSARIENFARSLHCGCNVIVHSGSKHMELWNEACSIDRAATAEEMQPSVKHLRLVN